MRLLIVLAFVSSCGPLKLDTAAAAPWLTGPLVEDSSGVYPSESEIISVTSEYTDRAWDCTTDSECDTEAREVVDSVTMGLVYIGAGCETINEFIEDIESVEY